MNRIIPERLALLLSVAVLLVIPRPAGSQESVTWSFARAPMKASSNPCLKFLPEDWSMVGNLDVKALISFLLSEESTQDVPNPMHEMMGQYTAMIEGLTGIDIEKQVEYVTFFAGGDLENSPGFLVVVKGSFDNRTVEMRLSILAGGEMKRRTYSEQTVYEGPEAGFSFPEASTLVFGDVDSLRRALDRLRTEARSLPEDLKKTLDRTRGDSIVWLAVRPQSILELEDLGTFWQEYPNLHEALKPIQCSSFFFETKHDGILANALAYMPDTRAATKLLSYLTARKQALLNQEGGNVFLCSFLVLSELQKDGRFAKGSLRLTEGALMELWATQFVIKPEQAIGGIRKPTR